LATGSDTERRGQAVNTPVSYLGGLGLNEISACRQTTLTDICRGSSQSLYANARIVP